MCYWGSLRILCSASGALRKRFHFPRSARPSAALLRSISSQWLQFTVIWWCFENTVAPLRRDLVGAVLHLLSFCPLFDQFIQLSPFHCLKTCFIVSVVIVVFAFVAVNLFPLLVLLNLFLQPCNHCFLRGALGGSPVVTPYVIRSPVHMNDTVHMPQFVQLVAQTGKEYLESVAVEVAMIIVEGTVFVAKISGGTALSHFSWSLKGRPFLTTPS